MAATNYTPIQLYYSSTASAAPTAGNLTSGELAINITDGKLYYKDNGGIVQVLATKGAGTIGGSNTQVQYNSSGSLAGSANLTFNGTTLTANTLNLTNALGAIYGGTAQSAYAQGDVLYASATNTLSKLGIGTVNYILTSTGSVPQWVAPTSITVNTATNLAGGAGGSVPYQSAADTTTFLAIGAANRVMTSSGSAPQWVTSLTGLTGVSSSSITNTSLTSGRVVYSGASGVETDSASLTFNGTTLSAGGFSTTGLSTLVQTVKIGDSNFSGTAVFAAATPAKLYIGTGTVTDATSAIGATNATGAISSLAITPIAASNTSVTYTNASTLYIAGAPSAGTNITITNPYSLYVAAGASYLGGNTAITGTLSTTGTSTMAAINASGVVTLAGVAATARVGLLLSGTTTSYQAIEITNTSGDAYYGLLGTATTDFFASGASAYDNVITFASGKGISIGQLGGAVTLRVSNGAATVTGTLSATGAISSTGTGTANGVRVGGSTVTTALYDDGSGTVYLDAVLGSNTNIPLTIRTKGTGNLLIQPGGSTVGAFSSTGLAVTGYITATNTSNTTVASSGFDATTASSLRVVNASTTAGTGAGIYFLGGTNSESYIGNIYESSGAGALSFQTRVNGVRAERMSIDSSGQLTVTGNIRTFQSTSLQLLANQYTDIVYAGVGGYGTLISGILTVYSTYAGAVTQNSYFCNAVGNGNAGSGISMLANGDYSTASNLILYSRGAVLGGGSYVISVYNASGNTVGITYSFTPVGQGNGASYYNSLTNTGSAGAGTGLPSGVSVVFGQNNAQVKASGVTFPAAQSASTDANTLDDYEEGDWTPGLTSSSTPISAALSSVGRYTKIGNSVVIWGYIYVLSVSSATGSYLRINGLPFSFATSGLEGLTSGSFGPYASFTGLNASDNLIVGASTSTELNIWITSGNGSFGTGASGANIQATTNFYFSIVGKVA